MQSQSKEYDKKQILVYSVLSRGNFCREFTHFFGVPFTGLKIWWRTKNDKYEVCVYAEIYDHHRNPNTNNRDRLVG